MEDDESNESLALRAAVVIHTGVVCRGALWRAWIKTRDGIETCGTGAHSPGEAVHDAWCNVVEERAVREMHRRVLAENKGEQHVRS